MEGSRNPSEDEYFARPARRPIFGERTMLDRLNRKAVFDGLKAIYKLKGWTREQVDGLTKFLDAAERDPIVPDGEVGIQRTAYWIETMWIETAHRFQPIHEYGGRAYFIRRYGAKTKKGRELGNDTDEEAVAYSGVGLVQTTGENNVERLEAFIREHYPWIAEAVEADTGKPFDLTIGDQPDDRADVENMTRFDVAYVALVAGTTYAFYGPPLSRYINDRVTDYRNGRRSVNGTDRAGEFAVVCPKIEAVLSAARSEAVEPLESSEGAETEVPTPQTIAGAPTTQNVVGEADKVVVNQAAQPVVGGAKDDVPKPIVEKWWETTKSIPAKIYALIGTGLTFTAASLSEWFGFMKDYAGLIVVLVVIGMIIVLTIYLMHMRYQRNKETQQQMFEMQKLLAQLAADPSKINIGMKKEVVGEKPPGA